MKALRNDGQNEVIKTFLHLLWDFSHKQNNGENKDEPSGNIQTFCRIQIDIPWRLLWCFQFMREKRAYFVYEHNAIETVLFYENERNE